MLTKVDLPDTVQYSRKRLLTCTWTLDNNTSTPVDLTNAALLGIIDRGGGPAGWVGQGN